MVNRRTSKSGPSLAAASVPDVTGLAAVSDPASTSIRLLAFDNLFCEALATPRVIVAEVPPSRAEDD
jgi:hypothetical protein